MLTPQLYWVILGLVATYAFVKGRLDERVAASICILATIATLLLSSPPHEGFETVETGVLLTDLLALGGFTALALRSRRFWPLWVAGFQLTSTFAHALKAIHFSLIPQAYAVAERFWVYPIFLAIVVGTWRSHHRRAADPAVGGPAPAGGGDSFRLD